MGYELSCPVDWRDERYAAKVLLETNEITCRGELKLKIKFSEIEKLNANNGQLSVETAKGKLTIHNGTQAEKWLKRIQTPKSTFEKLGIAPGMTLSVVGEAPASFLSELDSVRIILIPFSEFNSEATFIFAETLSDLAVLEEMAELLNGPRPIWIVYPKGIKEIRETDVITAGRQAGLTDIKVVAFSERYTALKFVRPVTERGL